MHACLLLAGFWAFAFVTLCAGLVLLNMYSDLIGYDFALNGIRKELILAAVCSLIEGASAWAVASYAPGATRALLIPVLLVGLIYMVAHLEDWNRFDAGFVLVFQFALGGIGGALLSGYFGAALVIMFLFAGALALVGSIAKGL